MREAPKPLINEEIDQRVLKFFTIKKSKEKRHAQRAFSLLNPPPELSGFEFCFMFVIACCMPDNCLLIC
jgi:hypothetical protein